MSGDVNLGFGCRDYDREFSPPVEKLDPSDKLRKELRNFYIDETSDIELIEKITRGLRKFKNEEEGLPE